MWIICAGMSRSASTLLYNLTRSVVETSGIGKGVGMANCTKIRQHSGVQVIKSEPFDSRLLNEDHVIFSTYRHPFDVAVSLYHFWYNRGVIVPDKKLPMWDDVVREMRKIMRWIDGWENAGAYMYKYEKYYPDKWNNMLFDICAKLNIEIDSEKIDETVEKFSKQKNVKMVRDINSWFDGRNTLFTNGHFSPDNGEITRWKYQLPCDVDLSFCRPWMDKHGY